MSEKLSTVILKVDLQCSSCYMTIKKTLCKLQDREKIPSVVYDDKNGTVTISGPFDPNKLIKQICCKACNVIKDIQIPPPPPPPPPPCNVIKVLEDIQIPPPPPPPPPPCRCTRGAGCCCRLCFEAYYGGCSSRCCSCGWIYGPVSYFPPPVVHGHGSPCYDGPKT